MSEPTGGRAETTSLRSLTGLSERAARSPPTLIKEKHERCVNAPTAAAAASPFRGRFHWVAFWTQMRAACRLNAHLRASEPIRTLCLDPQSDHQNVSAGRQTNRGGASLLGLRWSTPLLPSAEIHRLPRGLFQSFGFHAPFTTR